jgi:hypothetical protein
MPVKEAQIDWVVKNGDGHMKKLSQLTESCAIVG